MSSRAVHLNTLLAATYSARADAAAAQDEAPAVRKERARAYWELMGKALAELRDEVASGRPLPGQADSLLRSIEWLSNHLAVGLVPDVVSDVRGPGATKPGPDETMNIRIAVTYKAAVDRGLIADPSPTRTIVDHYGINERTARVWFQDYRPIEPIEVDTLAERCREAGEFHKEAGRSRGAVSARAKRARAATK